MNKELYFTPECLRTHVQQTESLFVYWLRNTAGMSYSNCTKTESYENQS